MWLGQEEYWTESDREILRGLVEEYLKGKK